MTASKQIAGRAGEGGVMEYPVAVQPSEPDLVSADDFADAIVARWQDSVLAIIDVGKLLLGAKRRFRMASSDP